jgi:hypothetical protein
VVKKREGAEGEKWRGVGVGGGRMAAPGAGEGRRRRWRWRVWRPRREEESAAAAMGIEIGLAVAGGVERKEGTMVWLIRLESLERLGLSLVPSHHFLHFFPSSSR